MSSPYRHEWPPATVFDTGTHQPLEFVLLKSKKITISTTIWFFFEPQKNNYESPPPQKLQEEKHVHPRTKLLRTFHTNQIFHSKISESVTQVTQDPPHQPTRPTNQPTRPTNHTNQTKAPDERDQSGWTCRRRQTTRGPTCRWNDDGWAGPVRSWGEEISPTRRTVVVFWFIGNSLGPNKHVTVVFVCCLVVDGFFSICFVGLREKFGEKRSRSPGKNQRKSLGKLDCSVFFVWIIQLSYMYFLMSRQALLLWTTWSS